MLHFWIRWLAGGALAALSLWIIAGNAWVVWCGLTRKPRCPSWIPLFGGVFGAVALLIMPVAGAARWWWLPFVVDWGCLPGLTHTAVWHLWRCGPRR